MPAFAFVVAASVLAQPLTNEFTTFRYQEGERWCWAAATQMLVVAAHGKDEAAFGQAEQASRIFTPCPRIPSTGGACGQGIVRGKCDSPALPSFDDGSLGTYCFDKPLWREDTALSPEEIFDEFVACRPVAVGWCYDGSCSPGNQTGHWVVLSQIATAPGGPEGKSVLGYVVLNPLPCCKGQKDVWIPHQTYVEGLGATMLKYTVAGVDEVDCVSRKPLVRECVNSPIAKPDLDAYAHNFEPSDDAAALAVTAGRGVLGRGNQQLRLRAELSYSRKLVPAEALSLAGRSQPSLFSELVSRAGNSRVSDVYNVFVNSGESEVLLGSVTLRELASRWVVESAEGFMATSAKAPPRNEKQWLQLVAVETGAVVAGSVSAVSFYATNVELYGTTCSPVEGKVTRSLVEALNLPPFL